MIVQILNLAKSKHYKNILNKTSIKSMSSKSPMKNYYEILNVPENASLFEIESAYEKLAAKWHPDKHKEHRKTAEIKFQEISEAFEVLSDRNKRSGYDELLRKHYSIEDANNTFERFYNQNGILDENQDKFFSEHYPTSTSNYYKILGVPRTATIDDIRNAYRKLALKYHPKNNPNDEAAHAKFVQINEAYNALSNEIKREAYDDFYFKEMAPVKAHTIFEDFFGNRLFNFDKEDDFFRPIMQKKWSSDLDRMMIDEGNWSGKDGEQVKTSSVYNYNNGVETKKSVTSKKKIKDGKTTQETIEEYTFPNGEKNVIKTITGPDGKVESKKYAIKKGEEVPKELAN